MVVAQLVELLLPTPEIPGLNPDIGKILSTNRTLEKIKRNRKRCREWHIFKDMLMLTVLAAEIVLRWHFQKMPKGLTIATTTLKFARFKAVPL